MGALSFAAGAVILIATALDVFQAVITPRPTGQWLRSSAFISRSIWNVWSRASYRIANAEWREDFLGAYAPLILITFLAFWIASLVLGYGLIFFALREQIKPVPDLAESIYFAGTSLVTIGFGDFAPVTTLTRVLSLLAGASGLGAFAIITAFVFPIFGAYQQREAFVVMFTNRAGAPPSGVELIASHVEGDMIDQLVQTLRESEIWLAQVLETHLAYPILTFFRSTHDDISWLAVVGTILDSTTLALTTLDVPKSGEAKVVNRLGRHFINDFSRYFGLPTGDHVGVERHEFDAAFDRLHALEIPLRDREEAWREFAHVRATYASPLNAMAKYWNIPTAAWFADRSLISVHLVGDMPHDRAEMDTRA